MLKLINLCFIPNLLVIRCHHHITAGWSKPETNIPREHSKYRAQADLQAKLEFFPSNPYCHLDISGSWPVKHVRTIL